MSGTAATSSNQALACIAAAPVPPRVRQLLEAIHGVAAQVLAPHLQLTTVQLERELFSHAEKARNSQIQSDIYAQIRQLGVHATQFPVWFLDALATEIAGLREPVATARAPAPVRAMTLVNDTDIDRDIILHEMARREGLRAQSHLQLLGQRFGVLAAQPAFDVERLPVGPYGLCRILRECGERLELDTFAQLQLYHVFERQVLDLLVELLDRLNILLAREGVLPGLVYIPYLPRPSAPRRGGVGAAPGGDAPASTQRPLTQWHGQAPAMSWSAAALAADVVPGGDAPPAGAAGPVADTGMAAVHELLNSARQLLARNLQAGGAATGGATAGDLGEMMAVLGNLASQAAAAGGMPTAGPRAAGTASPAAPAAPAAPTHPVPSEAVASVLGRLQSQAPVPGTRRSFGDIHAALLSQVRAEHGEGAVLSPRDGNTLDLLGLLYTQIQHEVRSTGPAADLLTRLQVPLARAALGDEAFFVREQHPARELLNTVAEAGAVWLGEDDDDPVLLQKLDEVVEQVVNDYQGDETVFAEANQKVQTHLHSAARKAELAERRQIEAARGKERLEAAKQLAGRTIDQLCQSAEPPKFVQTLLHEAWSDVLTLTLLRRGEDSEEWQQQQQATQRIGEITANPSGEADAALGEQIEQSLLQVGYHQDEAGAIARRLSAPGGEDAITSKTELASKLKARARLGAGDSKGGTGEDRERPVAARTADEEARYRQLRMLPFGTWFEFVTNQQGDSRRLRLSWYSLITDHALFVNARGQKVAEHTLDALARLMAHGQLRIVTEDRARLIDRAWQATLRALRSLTRGATPEPAA